MLATVLQMMFCRFLDAFSHLCKRVCPSVGVSVRRSVRPSVGRSVGHKRVEFLRNGLNLNEIASRTCLCHSKYNSETITRADRQNASDVLTEGNSGGRGLHRQSGGEGSCQSSSPLWSSMSITRWRDYPSRKCQRCYE